MKGILIENQFLHSGKFSELSEWMVRVADRHHISLSIKTNAQAMVSVDSEGFRFLHPMDRPDFVLFFDKDIRLAKALENMGLRLFNCAEAVYACDDKYETFQRLSAAGNFPLPKTVPAPMTYSNVGYTDTDFLLQVQEILGYPMVVKECFGSFGFQVYLADNLKSLKAILNKTQSRPVIFQEYIAASRGRDLRLQVVGDKVVCAMERHSEKGDFRANLSMGGAMEAYTPSKEECELAVAVAKALKLDFAGVDLLLDGDKRYVCEVNSNAHFARIARCTGVDVADCMMDYIRCQLSGSGKCAQ